MDPSNNTRGGDAFAEITNTTPQGEFYTCSPVLQGHSINTYLTVDNQAPPGWRPVDDDPKARKRLRDRERSATMSDEKRLEMNMKRHDRYKKNNVLCTEHLRKENVIVLLLPDGILFSVHLQKIDHIRVLIYFAISIICRTNYIYGRR